MNRGIAVTVFLMLAGWAMHWLADLCKARNIAAAAGTPRPSLWSYWTNEPYAVVLSMLGLAVSYLIIPYAATLWPPLAPIIGETPSQPMTPMLAFVGGYVSPSLADLAGGRLKSMIGG